MKEFYLLYFIFRVTAVKLDDQIDRKYQTMMAFLSPLLFLPLVSPTFLVTLPEFIFIFVLRGLTKKE